MVKIAIIAIIFSINAYALSALEVAKHIVNDSSKDAKLELLFANNNYIDVNKNVNIYEISQILKTNSLANFIFNEPKTLIFSFKAQADSVIFFKIINDTLNELGYVYFIPIELTLRENYITYKLAVDSQYMLDPGLFYKALLLNSVFIKDISKISELNYEYELDFSKAMPKINTQVSLNVLTQLNKPLREYILDLQGAKSIELSAHNLDSWFCKIQFLDKNLNFIQGVEKIHKQNDITLPIPLGAKYAIIGDMFSLDNIKRGLKIYLRR
ncbi:hypothetical protein [Campylobacter peloridis]|uniref:Periplasmic protein n=1 Tax=Campylobacter peloridis TaxID=488546 RepID=A0ABX6TZ84_9BACT|nr:hypothetical protein [Campylobacter peloridis]AJC85328.1 hypothetical protein CPEL_1519 [Campylobacter peloridis LMG 23910]MBX1885693.1 hypothetical protein [Campylobacter peloridis]MBX2079003.1 hypothetical protein [Campylobacter peloridis]QOQ89344.1 hypothetical protein IMC75_02390 [Campylobacter peloridis]